MRGFGRFAKGDRTHLEAHEGVPLPMGIRVTEIVKQALQRGDQNRSAFFDLSTGEPIVSVRVLTASELRDVETARDHG